MLGASSTKTRSVSRWATHVEGSRLRRQKPRSPKSQVNPGHTDCPSERHCTALHMRLLQMLICEIRVFKLIYMKTKVSWGVPTMVQWVTNPTAVARVTAEAQVRSPAWHSGLEDPALPQLRLRFSPQPRNFYMPWAGPLQKKSHQL